jgi:sugar lactone lactonase YvrE
MKVLAILGMVLVSLAPGLADAGKSRPKAVPVLLDQPNGLALDVEGNLFISDIGTHRVLKLDRRGVLTSVAGTGIGGFNGDGLPALKVRLNAPHDLAFDAHGNLLIADTYNHRVRRLDRQGRLTTVAGTGRGGYTGDQGLAVKASLNNPQGIAVTRDGSVFIADSFNHVVRRVDPQGTITTFAGSEAGLSGDGLPATRAQISLPVSVAVAPDGGVYISDSGNNRIRRVTPAGIMETVLGTGPGTGTAGAGFGGDGGPVGKAKLFAAADLKVNLTGDLFISDSGNQRVRRVSNGIITTIIGTGAGGFGGDGGSALGAMLNSPQKLALGPDGSLYVADRANHRVRRVDAAGRIKTVVGAGMPAVRPVKEVR